MTPNKFIIILLLVTILLIPTISAQTIVSTELVKSEYPSFIAAFGFGDSLYKYTYSDGSSGLIYKRQNIFSLSPASITLTNPTSIGDTWLVGESPKIYYDVNGIGTAFDGLGSHQHTITVTNDLTGQQFYIKSVTVPSHGMISDSVSLGVMNTPGNYGYTLKETIQILDTTMNWVTARGNTEIVTISVIDCAASNIQTVLLPSPYGSRKLCSTSTPRPTPPPPIPGTWSLSIPSTTYNTGEIVPISYCIGTGGGFLGIITPSNQWYDQNSPVQAENTCYLNNFNTAGLVTGTYTAILFDTNTAQRVSTTFTIVTPTPTPTPTPTLTPTPTPVPPPPSPTIQPPVISSMINSFASFLKILFPFLPW